MNRWMLLAMGSTAAMAAAVANRGMFLADPPVNLQASTPGTAQSGHLDITGTAIAGNFKGNGSQLTTLNAGALVGSITLTGNSATHIIRANNTSTANNAAAFYANSSGASGTTYAARFDNDSTSGRAIFGWAKAATGSTYGLYGQSASVSGKAAYGLATATSGKNYGGWFQSASPLGIGAYGVNNAGGVGVRAESNGRALDVIGASAFSGAVAFNGATPFTVSNPTLITNLNADLLDGLHASAFLTQVPNPLALSGSSGTDVILAQNSVGNAIHGIATNPGGVYAGGFFESQGTAGLGVSGYASGASGTGVYGKSDGTSGLGVEGWGNTGVKGRNTVGTGIGVQGEGKSSGVFGLATTAGGDGVVGQGSGSGRGIVGIAGGSGPAVGGYSSTSGGTAGLFNASASSGTGRAVDAINFSNDGVAGYFVGQGISVYSQSVNNDAFQGVASVANRSGLWARNDYSGAGAGYGVVGEAQTGFGVQGVEHGTGYGVYGSSAGMAVFAAGNLGASGNKPFRIDHPNDPEHKYLLHYSSESPYPQNFYSGNITTDAKGYAWVYLPDYFSEINKNFKYQLTVLSKDFAQAIVSEEIEGNRFQIRTSVPGTKVSWRVEADRNDLFNRKNPPLDVITKPANEVGTYQMPELYGLPKDRGLGYRGQVKAKAARPK